MINTNWKKRFIKTMRGYPVIKDVWRLRNFVRMKNWNIKYLLPGKLWMDRVDIVVTTRCNLLCPDCNHLMPYYRKPYDADKNQLIAAMRKFNESFDWCCEYNILGGEPFLNPDLKYFLQEAPSEKCNQVRVVTNATIIPDDPELYEIMRQKHIRVKISEYPCNEETKKKLIEKFKQEHIKYSIPRDVWTLYGPPEDHGASAREVRKQFCRCKVVWKNLLNGKLYYCFRSSHCDDLGIAKADKGEYVDLLNNTAKQNRREVRRLMWRHRPVTACRYCLRATDQNIAIPKGR